MEGILALAGQNIDNKSNNIIGPTKINSILYDKETGVVIFSASLKIYFLSSINYENLGCFDFEDITCMEHCHTLSTIFMGTVSGKIIAFPWPNKPNNITSKLPTFHTHNDKVIKIKVTSDLFNLISIS